MLIVAVLAGLALPTAAAPAAKIGVSYSNPTWAPDGTRIAWESDPLPGSKPIHEALPPGQIWTANVDGSDAAPLVGGLINGTSQIAWPKPQEILYDSYSVIALVRPSGRHTTILHSVGTTFTMDAKGARVASARDSGGPIVVVSTTTGKRIRIDGGKGMLNSDPALSPDGRRIVFNHEPANTQQPVASNGLFIARANGKGMHRITTQGSCANWSPQGNEIAFWTDARGIVLRVVRPNGSHERVLVKGGGTSCGVPQLMAWSPTGRQIAVVRAGRIVIVNVASGHNKTLRAFTWVNGLAWSPHSRQLLVTASPKQDGCYSLWTINTNGNNKKLIRSCKPK